MLRKIFLFNDFTYKSYMDDQTLRHENALILMCIK